MPRLVLVFENAAKTVVPLEYCPPPVGKGLHCTKDAVVDEWDPLMAIAISEAAERLTKDKVGNDVKSGKVYCVLMSTKAWL